MRPRTRVKRHMGSGQSVVHAFHIVSFILLAQVL